MEKDLKIMEQIQKEKQKEIEAEALQPMDAEGQRLAEGKRFTLDVVDTPSDPLR